MKDEKIEIWMEISEYFRYIEVMIEKNFKQKYDISLKEFYTLYSIYKSEDKELNLNDLSKLIGLSQSAMSRLINRIDSAPHKLIKRKYSQKDRRENFFFLTDEGYNLVNTLINNYQELIDKVNINQIISLFKSVNHDI